MANATWLADVLRDAGLKVVEVPGWETRGRPGPFGPVQGVILHHTGSNPKGGNTAALSTVLHGRPDDKPPLHGPLSHLLLARDGTFHVVAAGRTNHAGRGYWQGVTDGNAHFIGIEAENNGAGEPWPEVQMHAYAVGVAAILEHVKADDVMAAGHKEFALPKGRKIDPTFDVRAFREAVAQAMGGVRPAAVAQAATNPLHAMLQKGDHGDSVEELQKLLGFTGDDDVDGNFGPQTDKAVRALQQRKGLKVDGKVGPATWGALGVK